MTAYTQTRWDLADLYPAADSPELEATFTQLRDQVQAFAALRPQLTESITTADFLALIRKLEAIDYQASRLGGFAHLQFAGDTQNQKAVALLGRVEQFLAGLMNETLFFSLWWKGISDQTAERLMAESGDYRYWLEEMRHFKPHTLTEPEEKIINIKDVTGISALTHLYDAITNRYVFKMEVDGEVREMTRGELMVYARHADPDLRAKAYQQLYQVYGDDAALLGQIYQYVVRDWRSENVELRHHAEPISARNLGNDIPDAVVNTLLEVARKNVTLFQRFFRLKARLLGVERLRRYDIYAPVTQAEKQYPFGQAAELVLDAYRKFDPKVEALARRVFEQNHLDGEVRKGKRGGAFCATPLQDVTPWVLLNYQGRADDVETMAHELGHAVHSMLAAHHSIFTAHSCLPLAETASTFGEMLLVDRMLAEETDPAVRRDIIFRQLDGAYGTIQRQSFFAMFERQAHDLIQNDAAVDEISEAYLQNLRDQFGDAVELSDEFKYEWVSIPHFYHTPFYVYAYAFGQLLVLALYQQYKREGESFKPRYFKILSTGGSEAPVRLLADAGIDIYKAEFWQGGFDVLADLVDQLEKM